jgi:hypothetical protein
VGAVALAAVGLTGGVVLTLVGLRAHETPAGSTWTDEIDRHGDAAMRHLARLEATGALREIGRALGILPHGHASPGVYPGQMRALEPVPPVPVPPEDDGRRAIAGGPMAVGPAQPANQARLSRHHGVVRRARHRP